MDPQMSKIFISHSSANNAAALALGKWLTDSGWGEFFLDITPSQGLAPGERWQEALRAAADRCEIVLILISPAWLASRWCLAEFLLAKQIGKTIFGVLIEATPLESLPKELTAEWQLCDLVSGGSRKSYEVSQEPIVPATAVSFADDGLMRLRTGLQRAGLDPESFPWPPPGDPDRAPYRGLRALEAEDAPMFFGRDAAIVRGLDALRAMRERGVERLFVILGASGAGKSSFLRAGLLPRLNRDDAHFLSLPVIRPERAVITGAAGLATSLEMAFRQRNVRRSRAAIGQALEEAGGLERLLVELQELARLPSEQKSRPPSVVIAIDQGEELFSAEGAAEAARFLDLLARTLSQTPADAYAIVALRSDSYERLQTEPRLERSKSHLFSLQPISRAEFKAIVEGPARRQSETGSKLFVEPALVERLINEAEGADALPLLAFTLERLFIEHGGDGKLLLADYESLGGVRGSIEAAIEAAFISPERAPTVPADKLARERLLRVGFVPWLARVDPDTEERKRRVARWDELPPEAQPLLERLIEQRLLLRDRRKVEGDADAIVVEVSHEALLRQWTALTLWLDEDAEALKVLDSVQRAATEWARNRADASAEAWLVHTGERLATAAALVQRPDFRKILGAQGQAYLESCREREERLRQEKEARDNAERLAKERELEQAKALAEAQRQRADDQAAARVRQRRLIWGLTVLLVLAGGAALFAVTQRGIATQQARIAEAQRALAVEEQGRTKQALAATERGLLRAQTAELRAMIERLDQMSASLSRAQDVAALASLKRERDELGAKLDETTRLHQKEIAESMGFRGDLGWVAKWEGEFGGVKLLGDEIMIDPSTYLAAETAANIKKRYEFLLSPDEMAAVLAIVGKRGAEAKAAYAEHRAILQRIHLKPTDVAQLVPEALEPWWRRVVGKYPSLEKDSTPGSVQTALLSLAFNTGTGARTWDPLAPAIRDEDWSSLADLIEVASDQYASRLGAVYPGLKRRRAQEANLIRAELKIERSGPSAAADPVR
jgi:hypothetical protein